MELANSAISLAQNSFTKSNENSEAIQELRTDLNETKEGCAQAVSASKGSALKISGLEVRFDALKISGLA